MSQRHQSVNPVEEPDQLDMYTDVNRLKQVFRQIEGFRIPFPATITGVTVGVLVGVVLFRYAPAFPYHYAVKLFVPLLVAGIISNYEPNHMPPLLALYVRITSYLEPDHRVVNRPVDSYEKNRPRSVPDTITIISRYEEKRDAH